MAHAAKHRHAVEGGYARGEETRARIVAAALKMFGERGFDGASTRDIAADAGVNAPALQYYFDTKEGVYLACVEHIGKRVWEYLSEVTADAERALAANADDAELISAFCAIQEQHAEFMFTSKETKNWGLFMARLQSGEGPQAGFEFIYKNVSYRLSNVMSTIVGRLLGRPADDEETVVRTTTLSGQLHVFHMARRSVLAKLNWDRIDEPRLALLKGIIREHTSVLLRAMVEARESGCAARGEPHGKRSASKAKRAARAPASY
jgi:TetR/AcrR family transcriptional regulator, regulator of cefoperazone and chloramphenicol sensitivity